MRVLSENPKTRKPMSELSDDDLVERARANDSRAYGELWLRHSAAAHAVARAFTSLDPDDVVAEAFTRILAAIGRGQGPVMGFRPYLLTSVRNVAAEWGSRQTRADTMDLEDAAGAASLDAEHAALSALERGTTADVFRSLPTRWQEALWYSEVDGLKPRQFAPLMGLAPNAASALVVRARRGFRDAWVTAQLRNPSGPDCHETLPLLGTHTRGALSRRDARRVDAHLETCTGCALAWSEARDVASRLALVLIPLVVGVSATASYAAWAQSGGAQAAAVAMAAGSGQAASGASGGLFSALRPRGGRSSWQVTTVVAVSAVAVVAGGVAWAATGGMRDLMGPSDPAAIAPAAVEAPAVAAPDAGESSPETSAAPTPTPTPTPEPPPAPRTTPTPRPEKTPAGEGAAPAIPVVVPSPTAQATPVPRPSPSATPSPSTTPSPSATPTPTPSATPTPSPSPSASPSPSPSPSASPEPSPSPTPSPSPSEPTQPTEPGCPWPWGWFCFPI